MKTDSQGNIYMEQDEYQNYLASKEEQPPEKEGTAVSTLYELNQQIIERMPVLTEDEIKYCGEKILKYLDNNPDPYYMLLCNELNYYTLFHITSPKHIRRGAMQSVANEILDIISNLGDVRIIEEDNNGAIAVWSSLKPNNYDMLSDEAKVEVDKVHCFYLFPYGKGVVEV